METGYFSPNRDDEKYIAGSFRPRFLPYRYKGVVRWRRAELEEPDYLENAKSIVDVGSMMVFQINL